MMSLRELWKIQRLTNKIRLIDSGWYVEVWKSNTFLGMARHSEVVQVFGYRRDLS